MVLLEKSLRGLFPVAFVAYTLNLYDLPFVSPVTVIGEDEPLAVMLSGVDTAVKLVIAEPPSPFEVNDTVIWPFPAVTVPMLGLAG